MGTKFGNLLESLRSSYWFLPAVIVVAAFGLSFLTQQLDTRYRIDIEYALPGVFQGGPEGARSMLAAIAGSMITAASVTFSITIAALSNASNQYGPRLLRIFMRDTGSQVVLGTFLGTFIYCLMALRLVPVEDTTGYAPHLSTTVAVILALASIGVLIYFIHHMATMLQVSHITAIVGADMISAIGRLFPEEVGWGQEASEMSDSISLSGMTGSVMPDGNHRIIHAEQIGYIRAIDDETLMKVAVRHDVVIRVTLRPGVFVVPDEPLAVIWPSERVTEQLEAALQEVFLVGDRRTTFQDIELYFDELIEIALRALSSGINDPYTAFTCIDWLTAGIVSLARRQLPSRYRYDVNNQLRIIADGPQVDQLIGRMYDRIRNAGQDHPAVLRKLLESAVILGPLMEAGDETEELRRQLLAIDSVNRESSFVQHERAALMTCYRDALQALNSPA